jgi:glycosyltransferase involved in cell wall biosynthesis
MKILLLSHAQYITVALPKIIEKAETYVGLGHQVTIVATSKTNRFRIETFWKNNVKYIISPSLAFGKYRHGADIWDALVRSYVLYKNYDYDVVHCIDSRPTVLIPGIFLKRFRNANLFLEWSDLFSDGGIIQERSSKLYQMTLGHIESVFEKRSKSMGKGALVISNRLKQKLIEQGYSEDKIHLSRYGVNSYLFTTPKPYNNLTIGKINFSYVGNLFGADEDLLLNAIKLLDVEIRKNIRLVFIGSTVRKKEAFQQLVTTEVNVRLLGDEYKNKVLSADVFLLPFKLSTSNMFRWPSKFGDYCIAGKPIVFTPVSDLPEITRQYEMGIMTKNDSPEELAKGIELILKAKEKFQYWGMNSRKFAETKLDWKTICIQTIKFYNKINKEK